MSALTVIFDTNRYRDLSSARFESQLDAERQLSIAAIGSYYVAAELLSHLVDPTGPSYGSALVSLRRLWRHVTTYDGHRYVTNLGVPVEEQLAGLLFGRRTRNRDAMLGGFIGAVANADPATVAEMYHDRFRAFADLLNRTESEFAQSLFTHVVKTLLPEAISWRDASKESGLRTQLLMAIEQGHGLDYLASAFIERAAEATGRGLFGDVSSNSIRFMKEVFPFPLRLYNRLIYRIVKDGPDMTKKNRANAIWDLHISFAVGKGAELDGSPLWLVTDDGEMVEAAAVAGARAFVKTGPEYSDILTLDWRSFRELVERSALGV